MHYTAIKSNYAATAKASPALGGATIEASVNINLQIKVHGIYAYGIEGK